MTTKVKTISKWTVVPHWKQWLWQIFVTNMLVSCWKCSENAYVVMFPSDCTVQCMHTELHIMNSRPHSLSGSVRLPPYTTELKLGGPWCCTCTRHGEPDRKLARVSANDADNGYVNIRPLASGCTLQSTHSIEFITCRQVKCILT